MKTNETPLIEIRVVYEDGTVELIPVRSDTIARAIDVASYDSPDHGAVESAKFLGYVKEA